MSKDRPRPDLTAWTATATIYTLDAKWLTVQTDNPRVLREWLDQQGVLPWIQRREEGPTPMPFVLLSVTFRIGQRAGADE